MNQTPTTKPQHWARDLARGGLFVLSHLVTAAVATLAPHLNDGHGWTGLGLWFVVMSWVWVVYLLDQGQQRVGTTKDVPPARRPRSMHVAASRTGRRGRALRARSQHR